MYSHNNADNDNQWCNARTLIHPLYRHLIRRESSYVMGYITPFSSFLLDLSLRPPYYTTPQTTHQQPAATARPKQRSSSSSNNSNNSKRNGVGRGVVLGLGGARRPLAARAGAVACGVSAFPLWGLAFVVSLPSPLLSPPLAPTVVVRVPLGETKE